jgi:hypothetical protein
MSSLWTPSGEHRVDHEEEGPGPDTASSEAYAPPRDTAEAEAQVAELRERLASTPAETVIANHGYGLFELGAIYLSVDPPQLEAARLAIDAFGFLVDGLGERLGDASGSLRDALAQLRLAYVQVEAALRAAEQASGSPDGAAGA